MAKPPRNTGLVLAQPKDPARDEMEFGVDAEQLESACQQLLIDSSESFADLLSDSLRQAERGARLMIEAGVRLLIAREKCPKGEWISGLEKAGHDRYRAGEMMRYAQLFLTLGEENRAVLLSSGKKNALLLASLDDETLQEVVDDGQFATLVTLSKAQLIGKIKQLNREKQLEASRADTAERINKESRLTISSRPGLSPAAAMVREEVALAGQQISLQLDNMATLFSATLLPGIAFGRDGEEQREIAAGLFYHALRAQHARLGLLLKQVDEEFGADVTAEASVLCNLSETEVQQLQNHFVQMLKRDKADKAAREEVRANGGKRPVGRPKGKR